MMFLKNILLLTNKAMINLVNLYIPVPSDNLSTQSSNFKLLESVMLRIYQKLPMISLQGIIATFGDLSFFNKSISDLIMINL